MKRKGRNNSHTGGTSVNLAEKLVMRPIGALVPYASNLRTHTPEQKISKIARNVEVFGFTNRILGPRSVCARLYVVRPHQVFGAETALPRRLCRDGFCRDGALHQVSALIR